MTTDNLFSRSAMRWIRVVNIDTQKAPSYAVLSIAGVDSKGRVQVQRPTASSQTTGLLLNGPGAIPAGLEGQAHQTYPGIVGYSGGTPTNGQVWGTVVSTWTLQSGQTGFWIVGGAAGGFVNVQQVPPSSPPSPPGSGIDLYNYPAVLIVSGATEIHGDINGVLTWTNTGSFIPEVVIAAATASVWGVLSTTDQHIGGRKEFNNSVWVDGGTNTAGITVCGVSNFTLSNPNLVITTSASGTGQASLTFTNTAGTTCGVIQLLGGVAKSLLYNGNVSLEADTFFGPGSLATTATTGFPYMPTCSGVPTGTPASAGAGWTPWQYDDTTNVLYIWNNGASAWLPH